MAFDTVTDMKMFLMKTWGFWTSNNYDVKT